MSGEKPTVESETPDLAQHFRDHMARLERAIIGTCDRAVRACPPGRPLKHALFGAVRQMLIENHRDMSVAAFGNPELSRGDKNGINDFNSSVYMYLYALCELAMDGNTLWDEPELLIDQYKHRLRAALQSAACIDAKTGHQVDTTSTAELHGEDCSCPDCNPYPGDVL